MIVAGVVPVKLNNERAPGKNTRKVFGVPLITLALQKLLQVQGIDEVYCYCSSPEIQKYLPEGTKWFQRSKELDSFSITGNTLFKAAAVDIASDTIIMCNATAPFLKIETIQACLDVYLTGTYDSVCSALAINGRLWQNRQPVLTHDGWTCPRSQDIIPVYVESEGCWVINAKFMAENNGRRIGFNPTFVPITQIEGIDLNTEEDWATIKITELGLIKSGQDSDYWCSW